jgi:hypothetical protein
LKISETGRRRRSSKKKEKKEICGSKTRYKLVSTGKMLGFFFETFFYFYFFGLVWCGGLEKGEGLQPVWSRVGALVTDIHAYKYMNIL